jgi:hypothetical protein
VAFGLARNMVVWDLRANSVGKTAKLVVVVQDSRGAGHHQSLCPCGLRDRTGPGGSSDQHIAAPAGASNRLQSFLEWILSGVQASPIKPVYRR